MNPPATGSDEAPGPVPPASSGTTGGLRWSGQTRGGYWGNWFFVQWIRWFGLRTAYLWLAVIAPYFVLFSRGGYAVSNDYLRRVLGPCAAWRRPGRVYRHFLEFGIALLDRMALLMARAKVECVFEGEEQFVECLRRGEGILLLGAHFGNWEVGSQLLARLGKPVNLVVVEREEARVRAMFEAALADRRFRVLTADADPLRSVPILAALKRGEIVALHGDRLVGGEGVTVSFLGDPVRLPEGPFQLAAIARAAVFQVFVVRERLGHYRFFTYPAQRIDRNGARRGSAALRECVETYATRLETTCQRYPYQWFNFFPFWER